MVFEHNENNFLAKVETRAKIIELSGIGLSPRWRASRDEATERGEYCRAWR